MLKFLAIWFLIFLTMLNSLSLGLVHLDFQLRREIITELFCINKDQPELACNGQCELSKRVQETKESEEQRMKIHPVEVHWIASSILNLLPSPIFKFNKKVTIPYISTLPQAAKKEFFHPPC